MLIEVYPLRKGNTFLIQSNGVYILGIGPNPCSLWAIKSSKQTKGSQIWQRLEASHILLYSIWAEARNPNSEPNISETLILSKPIDHKLSDLFWVR